MIRRTLWRLSTMLLLAGTAVCEADILVTRDGQRIETDGPWKVKGRQVIFTTPKGRLSSIRLTEVDLEASELATNPPPPPPPATPAKEVKAAKKPVRVFTNKNIGTAKTRSASAGAGAQLAKNISVKVIELTTRRVPEKEVFGQSSGTAVTIAVTHGKKDLVGVDLAASQVNFTDDRGNDLFALGRAQREAWEKDSHAIRFSSGVDPENKLSVVRRSIFDEENAREILVKCHALSLPAEEATISVKGRLVLLVKSQSQKSTVVSAADLKAGQTIKLGEHDLRLREHGSGSYGDDKFVSLECKTNVLVENAFVEGRTSEGNLVVFHKATPTQSATVDVFDGKLRPTDKIRIEYSIYDREAVDIDLRIGLDSVLSQANN